MGEEGMGEGGQSGEPWAPGDGVTLLQSPGTGPLEGLVPCVEVEGGESPTATFPELSGITLPHPFPRELDCSCMCLPLLPGKN